MKPEDKVGQRAAARAVRSAVSATTRALFADVVPQFACDLVTRRAPREKPLVALYAAVGNEAPTEPLARALDAAGVALALPVVAGRRDPLTFRAWRLGIPLWPGPLGIPQPEDGPNLVPDMLFVPLLAFDRAGHRLGYGGGYYDRTLAALRAEKSILAIGLAFAAQEVAAVSVEAHDMALDAVLTERGLAVDRLRN